MLDFAIMPVLAPGADTSPEHPGLARLLADLVVPGDRATAMLLIGGRR